MINKNKKRNDHNKSDGQSRKLNGGYAVDCRDGVTRYYDNDGYSRGSQGVDKTSLAYKMCGGQDDE